MALSEELKQELMDAGFTRQQANSQIAEGIFRMGLPNKFKSYLNSLESELKELKMATNNAIRASCSAELRADDACRKINKAIEKDFNEQISENIKKALESVNIELSKDASELLTLYKSMLAMDNSETGIKAASYILWAYYSQGNGNPPQWDEKKPEATNKNKSLSRR